MPSHKETNAFIKAWNNYFQIKNYSKMNITEKNKLIEKKVKKLLKEKSIKEYKNIQDQWEKMKAGKLNVDDFIQKNKRATKKAPAPKKSPAPSPAPAPAPKKEEPKKTDRARPSRLEKKDRPAVIDLRTKKDEPKKDKPSETIAVIQGSNQDINLTYQEMIDAVNRSMSDKKQRKLFNEKKKELKESLEERLSDKVIFTQMEQRAFDDSFERNYLGLDGKNAGEQIKKYLKLYKTPGLKRRLIK